MTTTLNFTDEFELVQRLVGQRWIPEIVFAVSHGYSRFNELLDEIDYISNTELSRKLKSLCDMDVLSKEEDESASYYKLTSFGYDLHHIFEHIKDLFKLYSDRIPH